MLSNDKDTPLSSSHGDAHTTVKLPAARKKTMNDEFTAKSSD